MYDEFDAYLDFYEKHGREIDKWTERIEGAAGRCYRRPDKAEELHREVLNLLDEFERFCLANGGDAYLKKDWREFRDSIQRDFEKFMKEEHDEALAEWNDQQAELKRIRSIKAKILSIIKRVGSIPQASLKKQLSDDDLRSFGSCVNDLEKKGKIVRKKEGSRVIFEAK